MIEVSDFTLALFLLIESGSVKAFINLSIMSGRHILSQYVVSSFAWFLVHSSNLTRRRFLFGVAGNPVVLYLLFWKSKVVVQMSAASVL